VAAREEAPIAAREEWAAAGGEPAAEAGGTSSAPTTITYRRRPGLSRFRRR
jgi:hypothetical protein